MRAAEGGSAQVPDPGHAQETHTHTQTHTNKQKHTHTLTHKHTKTQTRTLLNLFVMARHCLNTFGSRTDLA